MRMREDKNSFIVIDKMTIAFNESTVGGPILSMAKSGNSSGFKHEASI